MLRVETHLHRFPGGYKNTHRRGQRADNPSSHTTFAWWVTVGKSSSSSLFFPFLLDGGDCDSAIDFCLPLVTASFLVEDQKKNPQQSRSSKVHPKPIRVFDDSIVKRKNTSANSNNLLLTSPLTIATMDPRSHPSRPPSTSMPQGSTPLSSTPISSMPMPQYSMQPQYSVSQPHTLPPLQPHHTQSPAQHPYMSQPYRPDLSRFPASTHDVYGASTAPIMPHTSVGSPLPSLMSLPNPTQAHPSQSYPPPPSVLPPASTAQSYPQPIAPAPPRDRRDFNGMPSGAFSYSDGKGWGMGPEVNGANGSPYGPKEPPRTQVVGSQGRRGILPSVPGRATPVSNGVNGAAKNTTIPAKDADGKFPCPHCNKTYLHAKHLKRHLLRREFTPSYNIFTLP